MVRFQLKRSQYKQMVTTVMRRCLLIWGGILYGALWLVGLILFGVGNWDAWTDAGAIGVFIMVCAPFAGLLTALILMGQARRKADRDFGHYSWNEVDLSVECQLQDGKVSYHILTQNIPYTVDLRSVSRIGKYKNFFTLEIARKSTYPIPFNSETESLYHEICEQFRALKRK